MKVRNAIKVVHQIKEVVPQDFKDILDSLISDTLVYIAPEDVQHQFTKIYECLLTHNMLPENDPEEWQFEVASIFSTKSIEECKEIHKTM